MNKLCACGCMNGIVWEEHHRWKNSRYINGHNMVGFIPSMNLVIECDGDYWHKYPTGNELDHIRTKELLEKGFKVLRLWERDIKVMEVKDFKNMLREVD